MLVSCKQNKYPIYLIRLFICGAFSSTQYKSTFNSRTNKATANCEKAFTKEWSAYLPVNVWMLRKLGVLWPEKPSPITTGRMPTVNRWPVFYTRLLLTVAVFSHELVGAAPVVFFGPRNPAILWVPLFSLNSVLLLVILRKCPIKLHPRFLFGA